MKILVIFTGGTITCSVQGQWMRLDSRNEYVLINSYHGKKVEFDTVEPYEVLSENNSAEHINKLIKCVSENFNMGYDGIIIAHGTDTLQYTSCALSYAFGKSIIPVLVVSSNYPLSDERANGALNFEGAVAFIASGNEKGVFIAYSNDNKEVAFYRPNAVFSHGEYTDKLFCTDNSIFAYYINKQIIKNVDYKENNYAKPLGVYELKTDSGILTVSSYPSDGYHYNLNNVKAIILRPYHSGTLNTESNALKIFSEKARLLKIPIFVTDIYGEVTYESTKLYNKLGLITLFESAFPAIYVKVWIGISLGKNLSEFVECPIAGEFKKNVNYGKNS